VLLNIRQIYEQIGCKQGMNISSGLQKNYFQEGKTRLTLIFVIVSGSEQATFVPVLMPEMKSS